MRTISTAIFIAVAPQFEMSSMAPVLRRHAILSDAGDTYLMQNEAMSNESHPRRSPQPSLSVQSASGLPERRSG
jgi:hypothetical protein